MTTDNFEKAANIEAWSRYPESDGGGQGFRIGFKEGAEWARPHLAAQGPTDAEQEARWAVEHKHQFHGSQCVCGFDTERARTRTEHIMTHYFDEVRTARAARRDEDQR